LPTRAQSKKCRIGDSAAELEANVRCHWFLFQFWHDPVIPNNRDVPILVDNVDFVVAMQVCKPKLAIAMFIGILHRCILEAVHIHETVLRHSFKRDNLRFVQSPPRVRLFKEVGSGTLPPHGMLLPTLRLRVECCIVPGVWLHSGPQARGASQEH